MTSITPQAIALERISVSYRNVAAVKNISLSLTHTAAMAMAMVILEGD